MENFNIQKIKNFDPQKAFIIKGYSMLPSLQTGDILIIEKENPENLKKGDIIAFDTEKNEKFIVHRLLNCKKTKDGVKLITKGDNNLSYDREIKPDEYVGRGHYILRGNRTINLRNPFQKVFSKVAVFLSVANFNLRSFKLSPLTKVFKENRFVIKMLSGLYSSHYQCTTYPIPDSKEKLIRAFCKKKCFAHGIIDIENEKITLKKWRINYPFYHTNHGRNFIISLINHVKKSSKRYLTIQNLYKNNPLRVILDKYDIKNCSNEPERDFMIDINALKRDFACKNG